MDGVQEATVLTSPDRALEVGFEPAAGGRLAWLRFDGVELVLAPGRVPGFHGDTFWPSPQSLFDWPPPAALDREPYEVLVASPQLLVLRSAPEPGLGLQVRKQWRLDGHGLAMAFHLANTGSRPIAVAPWQVTRAPRVGLAVWEAGEPFTDEDRLVKQREDPGCWYVHERGPTTFPGLLAHDGLAGVVVPEVPRTCKLFADARGWLAHVHDGVLFLREFPDLRLDEIAPRQGEVELFFGLERNYIELENQGAHVALAPGEHLSYSTRWRFARVAPDLPTDRITPELVTAIAALRAHGIPSRAR